MTKLTAIFSQMQLFSDLKKDQTATAKIEYALLVFFIGAGLIVLLNAIGISMADMYDFVSETMSGR